MNRNMNRNKCLLDTAHYLKIPARFIAEKFWDGVKDADERPPTLLPLGTEFYASQIEMELRRPPARSEELGYCVARYRRRALHDQS